MPAFQVATQARLTSMAARQSWGSSLGVDEFAAISRVGFEPVGQVLGAAVYNVGAPGLEECPYGLAVVRREGPVYRPPGQLPFLSPTVQPPKGIAAIGSAHPLVAVLYQARRAAISRMLTECTALGGLGVIGVALTVGPFGESEDTLEFRAFGTAVRARGVVSRAQPFASDLSGQDFTKLVAHGFVPIGLALGVAVGYRHDDWLSRGQTRLTAGNVEVEGYTQLVSQVRTDARNELELDLVRMGAEGVVMRDIHTRITERKCPIVTMAKDHVVEASIIGTAITQFAQMPSPPIYGVHKLDGRRPEPPVQQRVSLSMESAPEEAGEEQGGESGVHQPGEESPDHQG